MMMMLLMIMMMVVVTVVVVMVVAVHDMAANEMDVSGSDYYFDNTIILVRVAPNQILL